MDEIEQDKKFKQLKEMERLKERNICSAKECSA